MPDVPVIRASNGSDLAVSAGTLTFVFTDIVRSTPLWEQHPDSMAVALSMHDQHVRAVIEEAGGSVFSLTGDGFGSAFGRAQDALRAAVNMQASTRRATGWRASSASTPASPTPICGPSLVRASP